MVPFLRGDAAPWSSSNASAGASLPGPTQAAPAAGVTEHPGSWPRSRDRNTRLPGRIMFMALAGRLDAARSGTKRIQAGEVQWPPRILLGGNTCAVALLCLRGILPRPHVSQSVRLARHPCL